VSRALFVSDIHISSATDPKAGLFLRFLDVCTRADVSELFLVGDIFDLWVADRAYFTREYSDIIVKMRQVIASGVHVHYFEGNHDLDLRRFWQHQIGCDVHSEAAYFTVGKFKLRIEHGDQMDPDDRGYLFLRWLLRTRLMVALGRYLPNFAVAWIGRRASLSSRDYTSQIKTASDEEVRRKIRNHAGRMFTFMPFDILVSGHVHVAEDTVEEYRGEKYRCINMGTWLKTPIVLEINGDRAELKSVDEVVKE
jgi:UDP-2,3-diacylglucosamine hydrolase